MSWKDILKSNDPETDEDVVWVDGKPERTRYPSEPPNEKPGEDFESAGEGYMWLDGKKVSKDTSQMDDITRRRYFSWLLTGISG
tara:strand:+ start:8198 stop:8449 length:252 start_codon:yes stop_codon:yes gene_type:complete